MLTKQLHMHLPAGTKHMVASLDLPGSKSIANRVLPLAALAHGTSIIHNVPDVAEDVQLMLGAIKQLGVVVEKIASQPNGCSSYKIHGCNGKLPVRRAELFLGNSGTSIRFLTAMLALLSGEYVLTGIKRMKERPIRDLVAAMCHLGARIEYLENDGYPPLKISPFVDNGNLMLELSGKISSQYLTGILMALPLLSREVGVKIHDELISRPYVDMTIALLSRFGVKAGEEIPNVFTIKPGSGLKALEYIVEPDASSASYFLALGALNGKIRVNHLTANSLQGDCNFARVLKRMGAHIEYKDDCIVVSKAGHLRGITVNMEDMPDAAMTVAVLALFADGTTQIDGIASWKVKETDRLHAIYTELTKLGAQVSYTNSSITITPPSDILPNIAIDTYNDHRMAMCFSLLAAGGIPVTINDYACVGKTFANYFDLFKHIVYAPCL